MGKIEMNQVLPLAEYVRVRDEFRARVMAIKEQRRVLVGPYLNFLFENRDTMLYQVQEMIRAENLTSPDAIRHEVETYNQMIPGPNEISATLLVELDDPVQRAYKLRELVGLEDCVSLLVDRDYQIQADFDRSQLDPEKISSVQFLVFRLGETAAEALLPTENVELLVTHPACSYRMALSKQQIAALREDILAHR